MRPTRIPRSFFFWIDDAPVRFVPWGLVVSLPSGAHYFSYERGALDSTSESPSAWDIAWRTLALMKALGVADPPRYAPPPARPTKHTPSHGGGRWI